ncbi:hypothetical protein [Candidatus Enterococcus clewellii]|uniref:Uncharacterized protein n=1 Tax=Candidatus Enterococcus clewellii TaxID=1834193 RepID=A0AAQ3Y2G7_9ENTE
MYIEEEKKIVRNRILCKSVNELSVKRYSSSCVSRDYINKIHNYFSMDDETKEFKESEKIRVEDLNSWQKMFDSITGHKRADELLVCYLSGPSPKNDFDELISLGVLPQNIYAFENNNEVYLKAISECGDYNFSSPKVIKYSIEQFFKDTPKKFDIVYLDSCGSVPSKKHSLRSFASLCKFHRLNTPGIVITNFASPKGGGNKLMVEGYLDMMALYLFCKQRNHNNLIVDNNNELFSNEFFRLKEEIEMNFDHYYGEFITHLLMDISSVIIPAQRFTSSAYLRSVSKEKMKKISKIKLADVNNEKNGSIYKFFLLAKYIEENEVFSKETQKLIKSLLSECKGFDSEGGYEILDSLNYIRNMREATMDFNTSFKSQIDYFSDAENIYQFLDKPSSKLFTDLVINQIGFPLHPVVEKIDRFCYKAKETKMYTDVLVLDECRYIYEWLPMIDQTAKAFSNKSIQYIFRYCLDGLIKNRLSYNSDYFFGCSVISSGIQGFGNKILSKRIGF